jgi:hypothetical protein
LVAGSNPAGPKRLTKDIPTPDTYNKTVSGFKLVSLPVDPWPTPGVGYRSKENMPTLEGVPEIKREGWADDDWAQVQFLITQVQWPGLAEQYVAGIHQWDLTVRLFRRVERLHFIERTPTEEDQQFHKATLHTLIGMGQFLALRVKAVSDDELAKAGIVRPKLSADVQELEDHFLMFYGPEPGEVPQSFVEALADFEAGRFVPMETALNEPPPGS